MKKIGGVVCWNKALEKELDTDKIRDEQICKVLRKIGVLNIQPVESMSQKGVRWGLNLEKAMEYVKMAQN